MTGEPGQVALGEATGAAAGAAGRPKGARAGFQREVAHRLFAQEFNPSRHHIQGQGEKEPSFLVSPLGAKVNRLHVVGVCTEVEPVGEGGDGYRARISDPTGVFTVYAGQYQPEAAQVLSQLEVPCFVAVTGKARTYEPEPGSVFVSIRPESVAVVDQAARDQWVLQTARRTVDRMKAVEAARDANATAESLGAAGHSRLDAEGALLAREPYGAVDLERHRAMVKSCLGYLLPGGQVPVHEEAPQPAAPTEAPAWKAPTAAPAGNAAEDALDDAILATVKRLEGSKGARWDDILGEASKTGNPAEKVEESLNRLMDKG
ncbi:MAG TPA: hypothetical protein VI796_06540, partial [Candidatus Thermoplasmatota archaeon]|nr:hypothetical protein [Candidatus Thermoplasmatota archaeon]